MPRIRNVGGVRPLPFLYVPAVLNVVTNGNSTGTKNVLKWNRALGFVQDPRDGFGHYHSSSPERSQQRSKQP